MNDNEPQKPATAGNSISTDPQQIEDALKRQMDASAELHIWKDTLHDSITQSNKLLGQIKQRQLATASKDPDLKAKLLPALSELASSLASAADGILTDIATEIIERLKATRAYGNCELSPEEEAAFSKRLSQAKEQSQLDLQDVQLNVAYSYLVDCAYKMALASVTNEEDWTLPPQAELQSQIKSFKTVCNFTATYAKDARSTMAETSNGGDLGPMSVVDWAESYMERISKDLQSGDVNSAKFSIDVYTARADRDEYKNLICNLNRDLGSSWSEFLAAQAYFNALQDKVDFETSAELQNILNAANSQWFGALKQASEYVPILKVMLIVLPQLPELVT